MIKTYTKKDFDTSLRQKVLQPKVKKCVDCGGNFKRITQGGYFCSVKCSKEFANECADMGIRRLGQSLVRYNKGDRRAG
jgi:protein-arginine kinase activator protein McsA|tara:strand:- start:646 stop:882 length:237 start_codon:yes stop_codon:yes gene_type:complete